VVSIGHFMEHHYLYVNRGYCAGDLMRLQKYSDMGGLDMVCRHMYPGQRPHSVYQTPKLCSSVSHAYNKADHMTMCEMFGAYRQDITYPQMKWLTDQMQVRGVNFMIPHSFNPRAPFDTDCPPYFYNGGFEPRYPLYRVYADYTSRMSLLLSGGKHVCPIALLFSGIPRQVGAMTTPEDLTSAIQDALYDCDWIPFEVFEGAASLRGKDVALYDERYQVLVVPPVEVIPYATLAKAKDFFDNGGVVIGYGRLPTKSATLGKTGRDIAALCDAIWGPAAPGRARCKTGAAGGRSYFLPEKPTPEDLQNVLAGDAGIRPALEVLAGDTGRWLHVLHRRKSGRDIFLVCNQNHEGAARAFTFRITAEGEPECWDAMRNEITSVPFRRIDARTVEADVTLEPSESVLMVFHPEKRRLPTRITARTPPAGDPIPVRSIRPPPEKFRVVKATYGIPGDVARCRDVRDRLQQAIDSGARNLRVSRLAVGDDPAPNVVKTLEAEFAVGDRKIKITGTDPQTIGLSERGPVTDQELSRLAAGRPYTVSPVDPDPFEGVGEIPAAVDLASSRVCLEADEIRPEAAARVTVNGRDAGGFIGNPLRIEVTAYLKSGANTIRIEPFAPRSVRLVVYERDGPARIRGAGD
jgi:hypothetical protein